MIVQPTLVIPPVIEAGLASGEYFRNGSVVRAAASGQIVKLLDEIPKPVTQERAAQTISQLTTKLKDPRIAVPTLLVGTVVVVGIAMWRKRDPGQDELEVADAPAVPECVDRYNASLAAYVEAIRDRRLNLQLLDQVLADLDEVRSYADPNGGVILDFSTEHAKALLSIVADYTMQLAEANGVDLAEPIEEPLEAKPSEIDSLRRHLEVQRQIFTDAA